MKVKCVLTFGAGVLLAAVLQADVLRLKDGPAAQGTLISANSREIVFLGTDGTTKTYLIDSVAGIDFATLSAPSLAAVPARPQAAAVITVPAGTQIAVRTIDAIDGNTAKAGARYRASIDEPVMVGSQTAIPRGANCTLEVVALQAGQEMALRLRDVNVAGKLYSTSTEYAEVEATGSSKAQSGVKRGIGLGAVGAGVGALAGGGQGAAIGGAIGAGVGAASSAGAKGKEINVPTETRLVLALKAPLPMN
jgi:hypothetical protein